MSLAQQNADPEIEFQSPCLNLISDEAKSFIRRLAALDLLHCPTQRLTPTPTITTTTDTSLHVYLSLDVTTGVLEQGGTAPWLI